MREVLDRLKEIDATLCDRMNARSSLGETPITSPALHWLGDARAGIWRARKALRKLEGPTCEKS